MDRVIKNILSKIEKDGYEAYVVGGFVRDKLLNKNSFDVDICTNALPKEIINLFKIKQNNVNYGGVSFKVKKYTFDITTYRKEIKYDDRKPVEVEYINNLLEDIQRRDFTINSLCMDKNDSIIDPLNGQEDLKNKTIKMVGDAKQKFTEDPLRMLRAIRFATILHFEIEDNTFLHICNNKEKIATLSGERIKEELSKILSNDNFMVGLSLLDKTGISKIIGLKYDNIVFTDDILGMYSQIEIDKCAFSNAEKENITKIKQILNIHKITEHELFNYGLYLCLVAGQILNIDRKTINKNYRNLPIKCMKDIDIDGKDIIRLLNITPCKLISDIINEIKHEILNGNLKNKKGELSKYVIRKWKHE